MNCEWKNKLIKSLKINLQKDKITERVSSCIYIFNIIIKINMIYFD